MCKCKVQILIPVSMLNVQVCGQTTSKQTNLMFQRRNVLFIELMGNYNVRMIILNVFIELIGKSNVRMIILNVFKN